MEQTGKTLSFFQLFTEENLSIQIPIIQRDYAQGRTTEKEIRNNFLNALLEYLSANIAGKELDFVYGAIGEVDGKPHFIPLDGQQRLTTLFLLHWYLALISGKVKDLRGILVDDKGKSRFNYETRTSTNEFCNNLLTKDIPYSVPNSDTKISKTIKNEGWFYKGWEFDPSVISMLEMLNSIEEKFSGCPDYFERLANNNSPIIVFQFLNLEKFDLTDDLYIKMNSRGKPLSTFENFKAKLEQKIAELLTDSDLHFELHPQNAIKSVKPAVYFSHRIDTDWLNYFWEIGGKQPKLVDNQLMNFIRIVLANSAAVTDPPITGNAIRVLFKSQDADYGEHNRNYLSYYSYEALGALSSSTLLALIYSFDSLSLIPKLGEIEKPDLFHFDTSAVINKAIDHNLTNNDRILFHAFLSYLRNYPNKLLGLKEWMRVVYNLVENTRIEDSTELSNGLREIEKMINKGGDILHELVENDLKIGFFYSRQVEEEKLKATLILKSERWSDKIRQTEKHSILKGQIGFIFEFSNILNYYNNHSNCNWSVAEDDIFYANFVDYADKAIATFDFLTKKRIENDFLWERTVLTKGDYFIPSSYYRYHLLTTGLTDRDNSWKRLLRLNRDIDNSVELDKKRGFLKAVFDDSRFKKANIASSCREIVADRVDGWRSFFINNPLLFNYCNRGFIRKVNEDDIRLLETSKLTYHYELRTFNLYLTEFKERSFAPLAGLRYEKEYGYDGQSHICVGEFKEQDIDYKVIIKYMAGNYFIRFQKKYSFIDTQPYPPNLETICKDIGLEPVDKYGFLTKTANESEVVSIVNEHIEKLSSIL